MQRILIPPELSPTLWHRPLPDGPLREFQGETMGTYWSVRVAAPAATLPPALQPLLQQTLDRVVAQMSHWLENSDLSRFNRTTPGQWQTIPTDLCAVLTRALALAEDTQGACDPTLGALTRLWGFGPGGPRKTPPGAAEIATAKDRCGWRRLEVDAVNGRARHDGVELDLSGIAKGFAVDLLAAQLDRLNLNDYLVDIGGELRGSGCKPDGTPWWVALEPPACDDGARLTLTQTLLALHGLAVATSGDYRRYFEHAGRRYAHTLDPATGMPVANALASVSVLHAECAQADALATALTVLGPERGYRHAVSRGIAALFVEREAWGFNERLTPALSAFLEGEADGDVDT